jgi:hypothetical protein
MKLTRRKRVALELLGPPIIGATGLLLFSFAMALPGAIAKHDLLHELKQSGPIIIMTYAFAFVFSGIQSIFYTLIMEWRFARGLNPGSWPAVSWSTGLGFAAGAAICLAYGFHRSDALFLWLYFGGIGTAVGFVLGLVIKMFSSKTTTEGSP